VRFGFSVLFFFVFLFDCLFAPTPSTGFLRRDADAAIYCGIWLDMDARSRRVIGIVIVLAGRGFFFFFFVLGGGGADIENIL
jgi:hypothetical protein